MIHSNSNSNSNSNKSFRMIYWYGERYYCAADVDAHMNASGTGTPPPATGPCMRIGPPMYVKGSELFPLAQSCMKVAQAKRAQAEAEANAKAKAEEKSTINLNDENKNIMESSSVSATEYWNATANDGTIALSSPMQSPSKSVVMHSEPADSPHSVTSSASTGGGASSRGRAIGKRNQDFYLPEGGVRLSHVSIGHNDVLNEWFGKYDKESNIIIRTPDAATDTAIAIYETLAHFAQEHDRLMQHSEYKDNKDTPNVWKNHLFTFYNTVTCKWEPLSNLRE
jgi:hypothetical protein